MRHFVQFVFVFFIQPEILLSNDPTTAAPTIKGNIRNFVGNIPVSGNNVVDTLSIIFTDGKIMLLPVARLYHIKPFNAMCNMITIR